MRRKPIVTAFGAVGTPIASPEPNKPERDAHTIVAKLNTENHRGKLITLVVDDVTITGRLSSIVHQWIADHPAGEAKPKRITTDIVLTLGGGYVVEVANLATIVVIHD